MTQKLSYQKLWPRPGTRELFLTGKSWGPHFEKAPLNPARGLEERCKLPQRGMGLSHNWNLTWYILALKSDSGNNSTNFSQNQLTCVPENIYFSKNLGVKIPNDVRWPQGFLAIWNDPRKFTWGQTCYRYFDPRFLPQPSGLRVGVKVLTSVFVYEGTPYIHSLDLRHFCCTVYNITLVTMHSVWASHRPTDIQSYRHTALWSQWPNHIACSTIG